MAIKRGVSLYSYQQAQFFKWLDLEAQLKEIGENLFGATGVELLDEMSLPYPDPPAEFVRNWFEWIERYGLEPVSTDTFWDVLQFRDHVMSHHEGAERLIHDIRLAHKLGFKNVRVLATHPLDVLVEALPVAEELDMRIGKEIHQPMRLDGPEVDEIAEFVSSSGTDRIGIVLDAGIFQIRPNDPLLQWYRRAGASQEVCDLVIDVSLAAHEGRSGPLDGVDISRHTAGNVRSEFTRFLQDKEVPADLAAAFTLMKELVTENVPSPTDLDYTVMAEALNMSRLSREDIKNAVPLTIGVHGKFYGMTEVPGQPGTYEDLSIDYAGFIGSLIDGGYDGYVNSEYEGQRFYQDRGMDDLEDEVEQVRRHQEMMSRLLGE